MHTDDLFEPIEPDRLAGGASEDDADSPLEHGRWYVSEERGGALVYDLSEGALADAAYLTFDLLLDGEHLTRFKLRLHEADDGRTFELEYGALNRCQARVRMALEATNQNRWKYDREGAWLKPLAGGDRVDPARVDRIEVAVFQKSDRPVRWCQTPVRATTDEPSKLEDPLLPDGPLLDALGQSTIHDWDGKTESEAELVERLEAQRERAGEHALPGSVDEWGGWTGGPDFESTGFFRVEHDGDRWWLVDPDGNPFWSTGLDCTRPYVDTAYGGIEDAIEGLPDPGGPLGAAYDTSAAVGGEDDLPIVNLLASNLQRAFGDRWKHAWDEMVLGQLQWFGFNTVGNWSDWEVASEAGVPYVRPLTLAFPGTDDVYRDFPDVFADSFAESAAEFAEQLEETVGDPALVGYFLGNEPTWGFAEESPAAGMLYTTESCATREELADWLAERHGDLGDAWEMDVTTADVREGVFEERLTDAATDDLAAFSSVMVDELYEVVSEACREIDPDHLNLGTRYAYVPGEWALDGMTHVDVFSINCYQERVSEDYADIAERLDAPVLVGEWHFGALDVGLPAPGIRHVPDQAARGDAYRVYLEDAAAKPWCVGVHYFTLYDESALGRYDGENWNIGFLDVCHRAYEPLADAARTSHGRLYDLASGEIEPYDDPPEYLPLLF